VRKKSSKLQKKNSWENNTIIKIIFITVIVVSLGIMFGTISYSIYKWNENSKYQSRIISINYVNTSIEVVSYGMGINADRDALKFGRVMPGSGGQRELFLNSTREARVEVTVFGEMSDFLTVDKNDFIVQPNKQDKILFTLEIPGNATPKNYTGTIQVIFLKP
jgi:hypothetical protein